MSEENTAENSSWKVLRDAAIAEGSKPSKTTLSPASLIGWYAAVWDSETGMENTGDIDEEDSWLQLSSKQSNHGEEVIAGRYRWWRKMGIFEGLKRDEGVYENIWLVDEVTWGPLPLSDMDDKEEDEDGERESNGHGLVALSTLDSTGSPFIETIHNGGIKNGESSYTRILWKKVQGEGSRGSLTQGEAKRLLQDGVVHELEMWGDAENLKDTDAMDDGEADGEGEEDTEVPTAESQEELQQTENPTGLKRSVEDEEGGDVEEERKAKKVKA